jgi:hypothetical protein
VTFSPYARRTRAAILQEAAAETFNAERDQAIRQAIVAENAIPIRLVICAVSAALASVMQADFAEATRTPSTEALGAAP